MTLALYPRRKQRPLEGVTVDLRHSRSYAADCGTSIAGAGSISDKQRARLLDIAAKCPVHRTLTSEIEISRVWPTTGRRLDGQDLHSNVEPRHRLTRTGRTTSRNTIRIYDLRPSGAGS